MLGGYYLAALNTALNILHICIGIPCLSCEAVLVILSSFCKRGGFGVLETLLTACDGGCLDSVDDSRALGRNFDVSLVATEEDGHGDDNGADEPLVTRLIIVVEILQLT
jgi:hypothetical protein